MSAQESQPKSNVKTIRDFAKSGAVWVLIITILILLSGLLRLPTFAGVIASRVIYDGDLLPLIAYPIIIIYVAFMSFIGYLSSVSRNKFIKISLRVLHGLLIVVLCLFVIALLVFPFMA